MRAIELTFNYLNWDGDLYRAASLCFDAGSEEIVLGAGRCYRRDVIGILREFILRRQIAKNIDEPIPVVARQDNFILSHKFRFRQGN